MSSRMPRRLPDRLDNSANLGLVFWQKWSTILSIDRWFKSFFQHLMVLPSFSHILHSVELKLKHWKENSWWCLFLHWPNTRLINHDNTTTSLTSDTNNHLDYFRDFMYSLEIPGLKTLNIAVCHVNAPKAEFPSPKYKNLRGCCHK